MNTSNNIELILKNSQSDIEEAIIILIILFSISIILFIIVVLSNKRDRKKNKLEFFKKLKQMKEEDFFIEKGKDIFLTPVQAGFLVEQEIKYHHIVATLLHFLDLGFVKLTKIYRKDGTFAYRFEKKEKEFCDYILYNKENIAKEKIDKLIKNKISISEIYIIDNIIFKYYDYVNADRIYEFYDNYDDYSKLYNSTRKIKEVEELKYNFRKTEKLIQEEFSDLGFYSDQSGFGKSTLKYSNLMFGKYKECINYKEKLKKDTLLPERSIENLHLWGEHLIYGIAFNVCKTSIKDATEIYEGKRKK